MIEIKNLSKTFHTEGGDVNALTNVNLSIDDGDVFGVIGLSGAGKSTLVRCINMLERPTEGQVLVDGTDMGALNDKELREKRREITMIFQGFNLLMQRNCLDNICFPLELEHTPRQEAKNRAMELLEMVGLKDKAKAYPSQLSGGQQQRIAIARALATRPKVLLCDEATSALDPATTNQILDLIRDVNEKFGITVVMITHSMNVVESICRHVAILDKGEVAEQGLVSDIFSKPRTTAARKLVFPEGEGEQNILPGPDEQFIRVVFNGSEVTGVPVIARMAVEMGIQASIYYASTKSLGSKAFGSMLLGISGGNANVHRAMEYLQTFDGIYTEEVRLNVQ